MTVGSSKALSQSTQKKQLRVAANSRSIAKSKETRGIRSSATLLGELKLIASEIINKDVSVDAPLMDVGLDSISATELSNKISAHLNTELSPTLLFDHPSLRSIADALSVNSDSSSTQEFEPEQEAPVIPTVAHEVTKRTVSETSGIAAQSTSSIIKSIQTTLLGIVGTDVAADAPLMSAGLDSISGTEFKNTLAQHFEVELPPTLLFDYPTKTIPGGVAEETTHMHHLSVRVVETAPSRLDTQVFLASRRIRFVLPGGCNDPLALKELGLRAWTANSHWPVSRLGAINLQGTSAAYGAFLAPDAFAADASFFGISRTEARAMDSMALLVLETTYGALNDSSLNTRTKLANAPIGFFLGAGGSTGGTGSGASVAPGAKKAGSVYSATSGALSVLSGRLSYTLGLTGPCLTTDTACSSSLVAVHQAVSALKLGESPAAAVAGVGMLTVAVSVAFSTAGMLSALGRCHTFDRRSDGYCRSEGCGAFYFSTESDDVAVSGTAVQQDGPSASLTAPNGTLQQRLIETVKAGNGPSLEAHGTGTALGDPIEVRAYFSSYFSENFCVIVGGRRDEGAVPADGTWYRVDPVHISIVKRGPSRGRYRGGWSGVASSGTANGFSRCC